MTVSDSEPPHGAELRALLTKRPAPGMLRWIGIRPERAAAMQLLEQATLLTERGIQGDRASARGPGGKRQVSLIQAEHLLVIGGFVRRESVAPELLRRNLVVSGINLIGLRSANFRIGEVLLRGQGFCEPCGHAAFFAVGRRFGKLIAAMAMAPRGTPT